MGSRTSQIDLVILVYLRFFRGQSVCVFFFSSPLMTAYEGFSDIRKKAEYHFFFYGIKRLPWVPLSKNTMCILDMVCIRSAHNHVHFSSFALLGTFFHFSQNCNPLKCIEIYWKARKVPFYAPRVYLELNCWPRYIQEFEQ